MGPTLLDVIKELKGQMVAVVVISLAVGGCQFGSVGTSTRYDNIRFMDAWATYTHCLATEDLPSATRDSITLQQISESQANHSSLEGFLPDQFKQVIAQPSSRLAVDVHAMSAACSLHTGTLAQSIGQHDLARSQFTQILNGSSKSEYSYYAEQALARLAHPGLSFDVSHMTSLSRFK